MTPRGLSSVNASFTVLCGAGYVLWTFTAQWCYTSSSICNTTHQSPSISASDVFPPRSSIPLASDQNWSIKRQKRSSSQPTLAHHANPAAHDVPRKSTINNPARQSYLGHLKNHAPRPCQIKSSLFWATTMITAKLKSLLCSLLPHKRQLHNENNIQNASKRRRRHDYYSNHNNPDMLSVFDLSWTS